MYSKHKTPIDRILNITKRLYNFETINTSDAALYYGVCSRTIARDFKSISTTIPVNNQHGNWSLDLSASNPLGDELNYHLVSSFANDMKIKASCIDKSNFSKGIVSFAIKNENLPKELGLKILNSIKNSKEVTFNYQKSKNDSTTRKVRPLKIFIDSTSGVWYLVANDYKDNKIKTFSLQKIKDFMVSSISFSISDQLQKDANDIKTIWHSIGREELTVKLYIKKEVAHYFDDIKIHHTQIIDCKNANGDIEISCCITNKMELLPEIKKWIPYIYIIEPEVLQMEIRDSIEKYTKEFDTYLS